MPSRAILHVDLDAFFVAVERLRDPSLEGRPVVVGADPKGGKGRGVVAAASYEARAFGIGSAMPISEAYRRCPDAVWLRGSPRLYRRAARAVRRVFGDFTPAVEPVSIDEAYLDLTGTERLHGPAPAAAERIRRRILGETGLPVSMGLGTSRTIAKIASELAKPDGFLHVWPGREAAFLAPLPLARMPGIGPATRERLEGYNLRTLGDLARLDPAFLEAAFGAHGAGLSERARGGGPDRIEPPGIPKSISRERTFGEDTTDLERCEATLHELAQRAARELRSHGLVARTVTLKLRYRDFTTVTRRTTLATPTDSDRAVATTAIELFRAAYARRVSVRLVGVGLAGLVRAAPQLDLFAEPRALAWEGLLGTLDRLRDRWGFDAVRTGSVLLLADPEDGRRDSRFAAATAARSNNGLERGTKRPFSNSSSNGCSVGHRGSRPRPLEDALIPP